MLFYCVWSVQLTLNNPCLLCQIQTVCSVEMFLSLSNPFLLSVYSPCVSPTLLFLSSLSCLSSIHPVIIPRFTELLFSSVCCRGGLFDCLRMRLMVPGSAADVWWCCFWVCVDIGSTDVWQLLYVIVGCKHASIACVLYAICMGYVQVVL